jgi:deazaflavin-dependent oxidoreductase (nitroreductase family)
MTDMARFATEEYCYLTTTGRVTGRPHEIEIWFGLNDGTAYMLAGGREKSDWVRNLIREPAVTLQIAGVRFKGTARIVGTGAEDALARRLLLEKYTPGYGGDLTEWGRDSLPVAVELGAGEPA